MFDISSITLSKAKAVNRLGQMPLDSARARLFPVYFAVYWSVKRISVKTWNNMAVHVFKSDLLLLQVPALATFHFSGSLKSQILTLLAWAFLSRMDMYYKSESFENHTMP